MFRVLSMICEVIMVIAVMFALVLVLLIAAQLSQIPVPPAFLETLDHWFEPFLNGVRSQIGVKYVSFQQIKMEVAYNVLLVVFIFLFLAAAKLANIFHGLHQNLKLGFRKVSHNVFMWQQKQASKPKSEAQLQRQDFGAVVAIQFEYLDRYPTLQSDMERALGIVPRQYQVFSDGKKALLQFPTTPEAAQFVVAFAEQFERFSKGVRISPATPPSYRTVFHCLSATQGLLDDEPFVWALMACSKPHDILLSSEANTMVNALKLATNLSNGFDVKHEGTFAQLANRTYPDVYRLIMNKPGGRTPYTR